MAKLILSMLTAFLTSSILWADAQKTREQIDASFRQAFEEVNASAPEKIFFETEVLENTSPFILEFKQDRDSVNLKIDIEKVKNYVRFMAPQKLSGVTHKVCLTLRADPECATCSALLPDLKTLITEKITKRGFQVSNGPSFAEESRLFGEGVFEDISTRSFELQCNGTFYLELLADKVAEARDSHDPHAAEFSAITQIKVQGFMKVVNSQNKKIKAMSTALVRNSVQPSQITTLAKPIVDKQIVELFSQLGAQMGSGVVLASTQDEKYIKVESLQNFGAYARFKAFVEENIPSVKMEERFMSPGSVSFAVEISDARLSIEELARKIKALFGEGKLEILGSTSQEVSLTLR